MEQTLSLYPHHTPCGDLLLGDFDGQLCLCDWLTNKRHDHILYYLIKRLDAKIRYVPTALIMDAATQLDEYFAGQRFVFEVPLLHVGTDFQKKVWDVVLTIPYGATGSYGHIAALAGCTLAVRAVANAIGANTLSIFTPCHRILRGNGNISGYNGGVAAKRFLLALEKTSTNCKQVSISL